MTQNLNRLSDVSRTTSSVWYLSVSCLPLLSFAATACLVSEPKGGVDLFKRLSSLWFFILLRPRYNHQNACPSCCLMCGFNNGCFTSHLVYTFTDHTVNSNTSVGEIVSNILCTVFRELLVILFCAFG